MLLIITYLINIIIWHCFQYFEYSIKTLKRWIIKTWYQLVPIEFDVFRFDTHSPLMTWVSFTIQICITQIIKIIIKFYLIVYVVKFLTKLNIISLILIYFICIRFRETSGITKNSFTCPELWFFKLLTTGWWHFCLLGDDVYLECLY